MSLTPRERQVLALLRAQPLLDAAGLARSLGTTKGAVSVVLSSLSQKGEIVGRGYILADEPWAVVVGGAAWDIKAQSLAPALWHTSNPSLVSRTPGGVGRNIAESIARLGSRVHLIAAIGADPLGQELLRQTAAAGVYMDQVISSSSTASYLAALDPAGELLIGLSDFAATDAMTVAEVAHTAELIGQAAVVVVDANIPATVVSWVLAVAAASGSRVVLEPVSVTKAARIRSVLRPTLPIFAITPNVAELAALVGRDLDDEPASLLAAAAELQQLGVSNIWVSRGAAGSLLVEAGSVSELPASGAHVQDVTGAGDSMTAGFVHGLLRAESVTTAARYGHLAAALTVDSKHTVPTDLGVAFAALLDESRGEL